MLPRAASKKLRGRLLYILAPEPTLEIGYRLLALPGLQDFCFPYLAHLLHARPHTLFTGDLRAGDPAFGTDDILDQRAGFLRALQAGFALIQFAFHFAGCFPYLVLRLLLRLGHGLGWLRGLLGRYLGLRDFSFWSLSLTHFPFHRGGFGRSGVRSWCGPPRTCRRTFIRVVFAICEAFFRFQSVILSSSSTFQHFRRGGSFIFSVFGPRLLNGKFRRGCGFGFDLGPLLSLARSPLLSIGSFRTAGSILDRGLGAATIGIFRAVGLGGCFRASPADARFGRTFRLPRTVATFCLGFGGGRRCCCRLKGAGCRFRWIRIGCGARCR